MLLLAAVLWAEENLLASLQYARPICHLLGCAAFRKSGSDLWFCLCSLWPLCVVPFEDNAEIHNSCDSSDVQQDIVQARVLFSMMVCFIHCSIFSFNIRGISGFAMTCIKDTRTLSWRSQDLKVRKGRKCVVACITFVCYPWRALLKTLDKPMWFVL